MEDEARSMRAVVLDKLVMDYFLVHGHQEAAEQFCRESKIVPPADIKTIQIRQDIRGELLQGRFSKALDDIRTFNNSILQKNPHLEFQLKKQQVIELIREKKIQEALVYLQGHVAPFARNFPRELDQIEEVLLLIAFEDTKSLPYGYQILLSAQARISLADEVNAAILKSSNQSVHTKIASIMKNTIMTQARLTNSGLHFPGRYVAGSSSDRR